VTPSSQVFIMCLLWYFPRIEWSNIRHGHIELVVYAAARDHKSMRRLLKLSTSSILKFLMNLVLKCSSLRFILSSTLYKVQWHSLLLLWRKNFKLKEPLGKCLLINWDCVSGHDFILPKGSSIGIFISEIHRDPEYYPDPEIFDPDRWLTKDSAESRNPFAYVPFSAGQRNCIGKYCDYWCTTSESNF
jgi:Cytochrome P450